MARVLTRPMFRKGGLSRETGIMSGLDRKGYAQGSYAPRVGYQTGFPGVVGGYSIPYNKLPQAVPTNWKTKGMNLLKSPKFSERGILEAAKRYAPKAWNLIKGVGTRFPLLTTAIGGEYVTRPEKWEKEMDISRWEKIGRDLIPGWGTMKKLEQYEKWKKGEEEPVVKSPELDIKETKDPEKSLMDVYKENKGVIDQVMGSADEDTKKSLYLQLAKFGAGIAAQPGGDLVGAIGKAAIPAIEGTEKTLTEKRKEDRQTKLMALSKTFDDMKEPEQVKLVKAIQKEYGFDTFKEAYDYISKAKISPAEKRANDEFYRKTAKEMNVSTEGFRREMNNLDNEGLGDYVGYFTRTDAKLPEKKDDRINGEYYVNDKGKPFRWVNGKLYGPTEPEFTKKIKTKEA